MLLRLPATATFVAVTLVSAAAMAQGQLTTRPERPYRGLFASGSGGSEQSLTANASLGGGYDDNILLGQAGGRTGGPRRQVKGTLGTAGGGLSYSLDRTRFGMGASVNSTARYYVRQDQIVYGHSASLGMQGSLSQRTNLSVSQSAYYMPFLFSSVFPVAIDPGLGQVDGPPIDLATSGQEYMILGSDVHLTHELSRRVRGDLGYGYTIRNTPLHGGRMSVQSGNGGLRVELNREFALNLGYRRRFGRYEADGRGVNQQTVDAGLDFQKALSFSRRTTVSFGSGSSIVKSNSRTRYRVNGTARINHEVGRTFLAAAAYNRNVAIHEGLDEPVISDAVTGSFSGLLTRRLQFTSNVRASIGRIGLEERDTGYDTYLAGTGLTFALNRFMSLGANYNFYRYRFGSAVRLPPGVPPEIDRQSVRVQLSLWAPLMNRARRP